LVQFYILLEQSVEDGYGLIVELGFFNALNFVLNLRCLIFDWSIGVAADVDVYHCVATLGGNRRCASNLQRCGSRFKVLGVRMRLSIVALQRVLNLSLSRQLQYRLRLRCFVFRRCLVLDNLRRNSGCVQLLALSPYQLSLYVHLVY
jgi:hypothetical protein